MAGARSSARRELVTGLLRRNRRRAPGERTWRAAAWQGGLLAVGLVTLIVATPALLRAARHHEYFALREVVVRPTHRLSTADVLAAAAIPTGASVWDVDPAAVAASLERYPWVHRADVWRELPDRVVIRVREKRPAAILALRDGGPLRYVARDGRLIAPLGPKDSHDMPFISGLASADLAPGAALGPHALDRALVLLRVAASTRGLEPVSEVHVDPGRGLQLLLLRPAVPIDVGWERFGPRLALLPRVLALWAGRTGDVAGFNLRFDDQVIIRTRGPVRPARGTQKVVRS